jgi:hypothetical protein
MRPLLTHLFLLLFLFHPSSILSAAPSQPLASFIAVKGKVEVRQKGKKTRSAVKGANAAAGHRVVVGKGGEATLRFFEGSELRLNAGSDVTLTRLSRSTPDKHLKFKLWAGKVLAKVRKLTTPRSSFEIEAGGVVCGVRGTEYSVAYDPATDQLDLFVLEGEVWASVGNDTFQYGPGSHGQFIDGKPETPGAPAGGEQGQNNRPGHDRGTERPAPHFDAFYGVNGTQTDRFGGLTDLSTDQAAVADQTSDNGQMGLGAQALIIQFNFPESP